MHDCCESKAHEITALRKDYGHVLKVVFAINLVMFFTEFGGGLLAPFRRHCSPIHSICSVMPQCTPSVSMWFTHKGERWQARAALLKGSIMAGFGVAVLVEVMQKVIAGVVPTASLMSMFGLLALLANTACAVMLLVPVLVKLICAPRGSARAMMSSPISAFFPP